VTKTTERSELGEANPEINVLNPLSSIASLCFVIHHEVCVSFVELKDYILANRRFASEGG